jgi:nitroreductase
MYKDLVLKNRSYRRFDESVRISDELLREFIEFARLSPSSRNQQALKFALISEKIDCETMFRHLAWAGYLPDWNGPVEGERPSAYILILGDKNLGNQFSTDLGIAAQSILLGAVASGHGGCMIGSIRKKELREDFQIIDDLEVLLVIALGKPVETVVIDEMKDGDIKYFRDSDEIHHVPKRALIDLVIQV